MREMTDDPGPGRPGPGTVATEDDDALAAFTCQLCGTPCGPRDPVLCRTCGEPVLRGGWAP